LRARTSARRVADLASTAAIANAGICPNDIDLLVNAGLYRDRNLGEPALAALIQEDVGSNPEDPHPGGHGTFSFDVANGGCGVLTALHIVDGFLRAGTIEHGLVVASDANPGHGMAPSFPFSATGAAVVCSRDTGPAGLVGFHWEKAPEEQDAFRARVGFEHGRNCLRIEEQPDFGARAARLAAKACAALLADHGLRSSDVDLVVASPQTPSFLETLATHVGCGDRVLIADGAERVHTAALLVALEAAETRGRLEAAPRVLLVSAGAGLVAGAALLLV